MRYPFAWNRQSLSLKVMQYRDHLPPQLALVPSWETDNKRSIVRTLAAYARDGNPLELGILTRGRLWVPGRMAPNDLNFGIIKQLHWRKSYDSSKNISWSICKYHFSFSCFCYIEWLEFFCDTCMTFPFTWSSYLCLRQPFSRRYSNWLWQKSEGGLCVQSQNTVTTTTKTRNQVRLYLYIIIISHLRNTAAHSAGAVEYADLFNFWFFPFIFLKPNLAKYK